MPIGKKSKSKDDEFEEHEEVTDPSYQPDAAEPADEVEVDTSEEANQKKKKNSKIIQYIIIVALIVFVASDYIFPPEEPTAEVKLKPRTKRQTNRYAPTDNVVDPPTDTTEKKDVPPIVETSDESVVDVTSSEVPDPTSVPGDNLEPTGDATGLTLESKDEETPVVPSGNRDVLEPNTDLNEPSLPDSTGVGESTVTDDANLTDQILEDLEKQANKTRTIEQKKEYVAPPDYEYSGRGLVYNCAGKHWACVDAPSYLACEDNASSVKFLKMKTECHPFNVYETIQGCESVQNRMVSSSAKTGFCND